MYSIILELFLNLFLVIFVSTMNEDRIRALLECEDSDSNYEDTGDSEAEDALEMQDENTDTEQEDDSLDEFGEVLNISANYFIGKDKATNWNKTCPSPNVRTRSQNIVKQLPGVIKEGRYAKTPKEIWKLYFSSKIIHLVTKYTNQRIEGFSHEFKRARDCRLTDEEEIEALLGLLLFAGIRKNGRLNAKDLFRTDGSSPEIFRLTMSWNRFYLLLRCLRFDDKETRTQRALVDKLAPIRDLFEDIVSSFKKYFSPSEFVTIDEKLEAFRGRCSFRQYIPSKPNKYGIKIYALTDAKMFYTSNLEVYVGQQHEGPYKVDNGSQALVKRLCSVIDKSGRNITCDNFFTSIPLVDSLMQNHKLSVIGTIRKNKKELPTEFTNVKGRREKSSLFAHRNNCTLVSYVPKKNKNVLLISSMHADAQINEQTGKPEIIMDYNATKGGVDTVDKMCETYNCARGTNRWPMVIFYSLMNIAGINSFIIYGLNNLNVKTSRSKFLEVLSYDLIMPHLKKRALILSLPKTLRQRIIEVCKLDIPESSSSGNHQAGRCSFCCSKKNRKTRYNCLKCKKYFCLEHAVMVCSDCYPIKNNND